MRTLYEIVLSETQRCPSMRPNSLAAVALLERAAIRAETPERDTRPQEGYTTVEKCTVSPTTSVVANNNRSASRTSRLFTARNEEAFQEALTLAAAAASSPHPSQASSQAPSRLQPPLQPLHPPSKPPPQPPSQPLVQSPPEAAATTSSQRFVPSPYQPKPKATDLHQQRARSLRSHLQRRHQQLATAPSMYATSLRALMQSEAQQPGPPSKGPTYEPRSIGWVPTHDDVAKVRAAVRLLDGLLDVLRTTSAEYRALEAQAYVR